MDIEANGKKALKKNAKGLIIAIKNCLDVGLRMPGLILLYASIDIMAWLNRQESHIDVQRDDFMKWVDDYLLPNGNFSCNAIDLYAARCGIVHSCIAESRLSRKSKANQIVYAWGNKRAEDLQCWVNKSGRSEVVIQIENLFNAFRDGVMQFIRYLPNNPIQASLVYKRANKFFVDMSPEIVERLEKHGAK